MTEQTIAQAIDNKVMDFSISISQKGRMIEMKNNIVVLDDTTFNIILKFSEPMAVLVNASYNNETFTDAINNEPLSKLAGFKETGMAEVLFNPENRLLMKDRAPSYWHYESDSVNRFNTFSKDTNGITCTRTIDNILEIPARTSIKIQNIEKDIYLVFITYRRGKNVMDRIEEQRQCIKLEWKE